MGGRESEVDGGKSEVDGGGEVRLYHDTLTIHWCGFSLMGLRHRRGDWIMTVFTA